MGDVIRFPGLKNLTVEELEQFEYYKKKMQDAENFAEMNFYYYKAKKIIEESNKKNE
ncbi:hypothetical protein [Bacillus cereus group sp. BY6-1LC]|uniref:hypothetical protein n=1 Tax=Bacillus cereus group sp. BY6-1LC TaxID=3018077 RepID=UPI0022E699C9|nr:hypothetical protein [Bacillus cereus group sp. BY6-1LC]MDA1802867.1 hypothetical protein [Bacillus cereus group sp. BY6-1LC]